MTGLRAARASRATARHAAASTRPSSAGGTSGTSAPVASASHAHAIRHGSRTAASPPGSAHPVAGGRRGSNPREVADEELPAPDRPVGAVPGAVEDRADGRAGLAVLRQAGGEVGVVVLDGDAVDALALQGVGVERR